jgi:murein DD-endopeptidase MepM/ murein hydrolase activator NlpD
VSLKFVLCCITVAALLSTTPATAGLAAAISADDAIRQRLAAVGLTLLEAPEVAGSWALAAAIDSKHGHDGHPITVIAHDDGAGWRAALPADPAFAGWIDAAPTVLLPEDARAFLRPTSEADRLRAASAATFRGHRLPYPNGWRAFMTQGPSGGFSHQGYWALDFVLPSTEPLTAAVVATKAGVVMFAKDVSNTGGVRAGMSGYANGVVIRHGPGEYSWYWHLAHRSVPPEIQPGRAVDAGTVIGWQGSTGYSSGPHLHFHVSDDFTWPGCSNITGCPGRETRQDRAPWNKTARGVDFDEATNEASWTGCNSRAQCAAEIHSINRIDGGNGAVLHWAQGFTGPEWKAPANVNSPLPAWLVGHANAVRVPTDWLVVLADTSGAVQTVISDVAALPNPTAIASIRVSSVLTITKRVRNDLGVALQYQFGSDDARVTRVLVEDATGAELATATPPCTWSGPLLPPGPAWIRFRLQQRAEGEAQLLAARWPYVVAPCLSTGVFTTHVQPAATHIQVCAAPPDTAEPNDSAAQATPLVLDVPQSHRSASAGDSDWFVFTATAGVTYSFFTTRPENDADPVLTLLDADGVTPLVRNDDALGRSARLTFAATRNGRYYARVTQWDPGLGVCDSGYDIGITTGRVPGDVFAPLIRR